MKKNQSLKHYALIGKITTEFTLLEFHMATFTSRIIGGDPYANAILLSDLSFDGLCAKLTRLFERAYLSEPRRKQLRDILSRADKVRSQRNRVVHSIWLFDDETRKMVQTRITARSKSGNILQIEKTTCRHLAAIHNELVCVLDDFISFVDKLPRAPKTPKAKLRQAVIDVFKETFGRA